MKRLMVAVALLLGACTAMAPLPVPAPLADVRARMWLTTADESRKLERQPDVVPAAGGQGPLITIDPTQRFQAIQGFGAALTDASAELIARLPAAQRAALVEELFGRRSDSLGLSFTRLTVGASDFSRTHYSFDDSPDNIPDPGLAHYSIAPATQYVLPVTRDALAVNPDLMVMISPWSAPAWMKTSKSLITGRLEPSAYPAFASYMARTVEEFGRASVPVSMLTIQNEPDFEPDSYPGMKMSAAERATVIGKYLGPLLDKRGIKTRILDWDHNWDLPEQPLGVLSDPVARRYVAGVAWHCYKGDVAAQERVRALNPDKEVWFTECSGGQWEPKFGQTLGWMVGKLIIASSNSGSRGTLLWNLALDPEHGPHKGGCGDCRGVVTINPTTGAVMRNVEYYVLGHASRFVRTGARRIGASAGEGIEATAFGNPDGSIAVILYRTDKASADPIVALAGHQYRIAMPPGSVATILWPGGGR